MSDFIGYLLAHENPLIGTIAFLLAGGVIGLLIAVFMLLFAFLLVSTNGLILVPLVALVVYVIRKEYKKFKTEESK